MASIIGEHDLLDHVRGAVRGRGAHTDTREVPAWRARRGADREARVDGERAGDDLRRPQSAAAGGAAVPLAEAREPLFAEERANLGNVACYGPRFNRDLTAVFDGGFKYIRSTAGPGELYDLAADPKEERNIAGDKPAEAAKLDGEITAWMERTPEFTNPAGENPLMDADMIRKLEGLGYTGGGRGM